MNTNQPSPIQEVPPQALTFSCPHCHVRLSVPPSQAGTATACPKCSGRFQIPLPTVTTTSGLGEYNPSHSPKIKSFASKKIAAGICGIFLGGLGVHKFILGLTRPAVIMLVVWIAGLLTIFLILPFFATIAMNVIGFIEGIIYLTKSDEDFYQAYAIEKREWF